MDAQEGLGGAPEPAGEFAEYPRRAGFISPAHLPSGEPESFQDDALSRDAGRNSFQKLHMPPKRRIDGHAHADISTSAAIWSRRSAMTAGEPRGTARTSDACSMACNEPKVRPCLAAYSAIKLCISTTTHP